MAAMPLEDAVSSVRGRRACRCRQAASACCSWARNRVFACRTASTPSCRWCRASGRDFRRCSATGLASSRRSRRRWLRRWRWCLPAATAARTSCASPKPSSAWRRGGLVVVAGGKEDGVASLRQAARASWCALDGHAAEISRRRLLVSRWPAIAGRRRRNCKRHNPPAADRRPLRHGARHVLASTAIDAGSRLLAEALPADLSGKVADFCAGWGYLSAELLRPLPARRGGSTSTRPIIESLEAATPQPCRRDAVETAVLLARPVGEPVERRYDAIVMNPPFHQGRAAEPEIGGKLIAVAAKALKNRAGALYLVANKGLPYERSCRLVRRVRQSRQRRHVQGLCRAKLGLRVE